MIVLVRSTIHLTPPPTKTRLHPRSLFPQSRANQSENEMEIAPEDETTPENIVAQETPSEEFDERLEEVNIELWLNGVEAAGAFGRHPEVVERAAAANVVVDPEMN